MTSVYEIARKYNTQDKCIFYIKNYGGVKITLLVLSVIQVIQQI